MSNKKQLLKKLVEVTKWMGLVESGESLLGSPWAQTNQTWHQDYWAGAKS
jgi:hypothetical protein